MTRGQCDLVWAGAAFLLLREATPPGSHSALESVSIWRSSAKAAEKASQAQPRVAGTKENDDQIFPMVLCPGLLFQGPGLHWTSINNSQGKMRDLERRFFFFYVLSLRCV